MKVAQFIDRLEEQELLDAKVLADLRQRVSRIRKRKRVTADMIAKFLVDKGHLTPFQATKLINEASVTREEPDDSNRRHGSGTEKDELGFADSSDTLAAEERSAEDGRSAAEREHEQQTADLEELTAIDDDDDSSPTAADQRSSPKSKPTSQRPAEPVPVPPPAPPRPAPPETGSDARSLPAEPLADLSEQPLDDLAGDLESRGSLLPDQRRPVGMLGWLGLGGVSHASGPRPRTGSDNPWDSKLLLVGAASLGTLVVIGAFLYLSLTRGSADEMFAAAEQDYRDGSYTQAIKRYDRYLSTFPDDRNTSLGRVRREMARLRQVSENSQQGLEVAKEILPEIETEESFAEAREGLAAILPEIAERLVAEANQADDTERQRELLSLTEEAMLLVNNPMYIPTSLRKSQLVRIDAIQDDMARVERAIQREASLMAAINGIARAVQNGDTALAYRVRGELLSKYPGLDADERLHEAVISITEKQRELVRVDTQGLSVSDTDHQPDRQASVVLTHGTGQSAGADEGSVVCALADGAIYALDASSGQILWRRWVGLETTCQPVPFRGMGATGSFLLVDAARDEFVRVAARTGELIWRSSIGERFCVPTVLGQQVLLTARAGKLLLVDAASGQEIRRAILPQAADVGAAVHDQAGLIYQLGEHDNLYVLSAESMECQEVFYLGHQPGAIEVPPVVVNGFLLVAENVGLADARLHVIQLDENGLNLQAAQKPIRLRGRIVVPPLLYQRRVLVVTDSRAVELYDIDRENTAGDPFKIAASVSATAEEPMTSFPLVSDGALWIANNRLTKYQVQTSTGKLPRDWVKDERSVCLSPLQMVEGNVIQVFRRLGESGVVVAATPRDDSEPVWRTELAGRVLHMQVDAQQIQAVTSRGRLYDVLPRDFSRGSVHQAKASVERHRRETVALETTAPLEDGRSVFTKQRSYNSWVLFDAEQNDGELTRVPLRLPSADVVAPPVPFADGMLLPLADGQVALMDPATGKQQAHAFHPEVQPGVSYRWNQPGVLPDGRRFVVSDDHHRLFIVQIDDQPEKNLAVSNQTNVKERLLGPFVAGENYVLGVSRSDGQDQAVGFALPDLESTGSWPLRGRVQFGPQRIGQAIILATDLEIVCLDGVNGPTWRFACGDHGALVGRPWRQAADWVLATEDGTLWWIDGNTGEPMNTVQLNEPLVIGPIRYGEQWLVATTSGTLMLVNEAADKQSP